MRVEGKPELTNGSPIGGLFNGDTSSHVGQTKLSLSLFLSLDL